MSYAKIYNGDAFDDSDRLLEFYNLNIVKVAELLETSTTDIPNNITIILLKKGDTTSYCREKSRIKYIIKNGRILEDKGRLIHEAVHVVQNYPYKIHPPHPCCCWAEGIADYCRDKLDDTFFLEYGDPQKGYRYAARFLVWLSEMYPSVIIEMNKLFRLKADQLKNQDQIFQGLVQKNYNQLYREYIDWRFERPGK
jgi:hypothetical protein